MPDMFRSKEFKGRFVEDVSHVPYRSNRMSNVEDGAVGQPYKSSFEAGWESLVEEVKEQLRKGVASEINGDYERKRDHRIQSNSSPFAGAAKENGFHEYEHEHSFSDMGNIKAESPNVDTDDIDVQVLWSAAVVELAKKEAEVRRLKEQVDDLQAIEVAAEEMMGVLERLSSEPYTAVVKEATEPAPEPFNLARAESAIQKLDPSSALRECLSLALKNGHGKLVENAAAEAAALSDRNQMNARAADAALQLAKSAVVNQLTPPAGKPDNTASRVEDMVRQRPWCMSADQKQQSLKEMKQDSLNRQAKQESFQGFANFDDWTQF